MAVTNVRRWQWVLLSLVIGLVAAEWRRTVPTPFKAYGVQLSDQKTFESDIVREYRGQRLFRDLVVYPVAVDEGGTRVLKHFVSGEYFDGRPKKVGGSWEAKWQRYCFVAPIPFQPMTSGEAVSPVQRTHEALVASSKRATKEKPTGDGATALARAVAAPVAGGPPSPQRGATVLDYLDRMRREKGVQYTYAWWAHPRWQRAIWIGGSLLLIGVIWPTCVNLVAFGSVSRPPEARLPGLWESLRDAAQRRSARPRAKTVAAGAAGGMADVEQYDAALENSLATTAGTVPDPLEPDPIGAIGPDRPTPPRPLAAPEAPPVAAPAGEQHHYEAKPDDFYPTEKVPHGPHGTAAHKD